jgi:hypothetical protein
MCLYLLQINLVIEWKQQNGQNIQCFGHNLIKLSVFLFSPFEQDEIMKLAISDNYQINLSR